MKSIVLCERTIVHESEDFSNLKDDKVDENEKDIYVTGKTKGKQISNGISSCRKSKTDVSINNSRTEEKNCQDFTKSPETVVVEEVCEDDVAKSNSSNDSEYVASENPASSVANSSVANARSNLCGEGDEKDCLVSSCENKITESGAEGCSVPDAVLNCEKDFSLPKIGVGDEREKDKSVSEGLKDKEGQRENLVESSENSCADKRSLCSATVEDKELGKGSVLVIDLDVDENKENEKESKNVEIKEIPESDDLSKPSRECEILVGDVQTITGSEKDSMWADNDLKNSAENLKEVEGKKLQGRSQEVSSPNENASENEKESLELEIDENTATAPEEKVEEAMDVEEEKKEEWPEEVKEATNEDKDCVIALDNVSNGESTTDITVEEEKAQEKDTVVSRKRQPSDRLSSTYAKKKRLSRDSKEAVEVQPVDESMDKSSLCQNPADADIAASSKDDKSSLEADIVPTKRTSTKDKIGKKLKPSEELKKESNTKSASVLEKFRGSLKTLTRSDLEELLVQKLCEVITERSNVGELRRKAQALEEDQERWKTKIQALTKQIREMEMVMKKYMAEVQKQFKEGDNRNTVIPLKVTRSVGLQVSFYSNASKGPKPNPSPPVTPSSPAQNVNGRNSKVISPKSQMQCSPASQNRRTRSNSVQKVSPNLQKSYSQQKRSAVPQPDYSSPQSNRTTPKSLPNNSNRGVQIQASRTIYKSIPGATTTATTATTSTPTVQQQSGSKVIDLTDDDDRQTGNTVKTSGPIRVVNHLAQAPTSQSSNRYAYLLPTTSAATETSGGQNRQVLIAAPSMPQQSRQIMCSMPPLYFKGGNVVQSGSQSGVINQSNKVILPKVLRHPAPLPQQPPNQSTKPNLKLLPPRPSLKISKVQSGIVLSWNLALSPEHAPIASYQLFAYQEGNCPPATSLWKKVGDVKALPLPMACTLTQFMSGHKYHFAVRAVDLHSRIGPFSFPGTIVLVK